MSDTYNPAAANLGFIRQVVISDSHKGSDFEPLPHWASFLVHCGFLARSFQGENSRNVFVLLLPTRDLAAPLTSLGVILGSLKTTAEFLTWEQFLELPQGTELFIKRTYKRVNRSLKGTVEEKGEIPQGIYRRVAITNGPKALRGSDDLVIQDSFSRLSVSLTEHPKQKDQGAIIKAGTFLRSVSKFYRPNWLVSDQLEALVVTTKAEWRRVTRAVQLGVMGHHTATDLADILLASEEAERRASRISVCAPGNRLDATCAPVAILDGPRALWRWRNCTARNLIILLARNEFDEEVSGSVFDLTCMGKDDLLPSDTEVLIHEVPARVGMAIFSVPYE